MQFRKENRQNVKKFLKGGAQVVYEENNDSIWDKAGSNQDVSFSKGVKST